jgi:hypothetical protein
MEFACVYGICEPPICPSLDRTADVLFDMTPGSAAEQPVSRPLDVGRSEVFPYIVTRRKTNATIVFEPMGKPFSAASWKLHLFTAAMHGSVSDGTA